MIIYFSDRNFNILGHASTNLPKGLTIEDDLKTEDVETGVCALEVVVPFDEDTRADVEEYTETGNFLLRHNDDEKEFYTIIDREVDTKEQEVRIYAEDAGLDLLNEIAPAYEASELQPIEFYINKFAYDSGFEIGINEAEDLLRKLSWDDEETVTARLASIASQFDGCEISFSFETQGLKVTRKLINIYLERGKNDGVQLRLNRDVDGIVKTESIKDLATALKCTGAVPSGKEKAITLSGYDYDDGDFYTAYGVLYSRTALETWTRYHGDDETQSGQRGHITKPFSYDTTSQETLCNKAIAELKKRRKVEANYEADIKKLPENVQVGDRVAIVDEKGEFFLSTRLLTLETSVTQQTQKATLGEHRLKGSGISKKVEELAERFSEVAQARAEAIAAQLAAQKAQEDAEKAKQDAETAKDTAENAETKVDEAAAAIQQAKDAAAEAERQAAQAVAEAAAAKADVTTAAQKAETAIKEAGTATNTANDAKTQATEASTTAAAAKLDAEKAKEDVLALGESLETLSHTMSTDYARKTDLTETTAELQTSISQNAAKIETTAAAVITIDETANDAKNLATEAQNKATAAQSQASQAATNAQAAQTAAQAAQNAAQSAQTKADAAEENLAAAEEALEAVRNRVGATETDIAAAEAAVQAAKKAADDAAAEAETAKGKADAAQTAANNAQTAATNAKAAADKAQADADALKTRVTNAETQISQNAEAIQLRATKKELENYATTAEMEAALTVSSDAIKSEVSANYLGKTDASNTYATKTLVTQTASGLSAEIVTAGKTATNFLSYDATNGLLIGNKSSGSWNGYRAQILPTAFNILDASGKTLASYGANLIELGKSNRAATISLCDGVAKLYNEPNSWDELSYLNIESSHGIKLTTTGGIFQNASYDNGNGDNAYVHIGAEASTAYTGTTNASGSIQLSISGATRSDGEYGASIDLLAGGINLNAYHSKTNHNPVGIRLAPLENSLYLEGQNIVANGLLKAGDVSVSGAFTVNDKDVLLATKGSTNYYGMLTPEGSASGWIRTTESGLIPSAHGVSSIGSSSWQFKNGYFQNLYHDGKAVSTTDHTHTTWTEVTPTAGTNVTISGSFIAYNTSIHLAICRIALSIKPTATITSGTDITIATLSGTIVPAAAWALSIYANSTNARRWMGLLNAEGEIIIRPNSALEANTSYTIYIAGMWYY